MTNGKTVTLTAREREKVVAEFIQKLDTSIRANGLEEAKVRFDAARQLCAVMSWWAELETAAMELFAKERNRRAAADRQERMAEIRAGAPVTIVTQQQQQASQGFAGASIGQLNGMLEKGSQANYTNIGE